MARKKVMDSYNMKLYIREVEDIQDGITLPNWVGLKLWLSSTPIANLKARMNMPAHNYYVKRYGYIRNGDVYEIDKRCVGIICAVVILVSGGLPISKVAKTAGISANVVRTILENYKYYVGWHNAYTMDGRRIWPAIEEVRLLHRDVVSESAH